ncbi:MAG: hypothetical protein PHV30_06250 [Candidatus Margulisbacteria bacterium]|nr:hypothetical protein [Candidatus Margulisiibacteriota bacterium]
MSDKISFIHQYSTRYNGIDIEIKANKDTTHFRTYKAEKTGEVITEFSGMISINNTALWQLNIDLLETNPKSQGLYTGELRESGLNIQGEITSIEKKALGNIKCLYSLETDAKKKETLKEIYNLTLQNAKYGLLTDADVPDTLKTVTGK